MEPLRYFHFGSIFKKNLQNHYPQQSLLISLKKIFLTMGSKWKYFLRLSPLYWLLKQCFFEKKMCVLLISSSTIWPSIILIFKVFIWLCARIKIESSDFNIFIHQFSIFIHGGSKKVLVDVIVVMFYHKIVNNSSKNSAKMRYKPRYPEKVIGTFESFVSKTSDQSEKPPVNR